MLDKNGVEIKSGDTVRIEGGYFQNDNGQFKVLRSPGDVGWLGGYYSLQRQNLDGSLSRRRYNLGSWPIAIYCSDHWKRCKAMEWNAEHATIEVIRKGGESGDHA